MWTCCRRPPLFGLCYGDWRDLEWSFAKSRGQDSISGAKNTAVRNERLGGSMWCMGSDSPIKDTMPWAGGAEPECEFRLSPDQRKQASQKQASRIILSLTSPPTLSYSAGYWGIRLRLFRYLCCSTEQLACFATPVRGLETFVCLLILFVR